MTEYAPNIEYNRCSNANEKQSLYIFSLIIPVNDKKTIYSCFYKSMLLKTMAH